MLKKYIFCSLLLLTITACSTRDLVKYDQSMEEKSSNFEDPNLVEIQNPEFLLPSDIHPTQIQKYFKFFPGFLGGDNQYFALVLRSSKNINLSSVPKEFPTNFSAILIAYEEERAWKKFTEIKNLKDGRNNPYYLWLSNNDLVLSVVDDQGAGSGEGYMKLFIRKPVDDPTGKKKVTGKFKWHLSGCFYFGLHSTHGSSFEDAKNLNLHWPSPLEDCQGDVQLIEYPLT